MNFISINFDSCGKLFLSLPAGSCIMKMHYSLCITILGCTAQRIKFEKFINIHLKTKSLSRSSITSLEVFCKDFVDISHGNVSFCMLEDSIWLQFNYFVTIIAFWFVKYLFAIVGDTLH